MGPAAVLLTDLASSCFNAEEQRGYQYGHFVQFPGQLSLCQQQARVTMHCHFGLVTD